MNIGEFSARLGVSRRSVRHYESIGLLLPAGTDGRTGYRRYGPAQLVAGVQIEQLKAAGLTLAEIRLVLADGAARADVLERRSQQLHHELGRRHRQLALLAALQCDDEALSVPTIVTRPETPVVVVTATAGRAALGSCVRREVQRLRRDVRRRDADAPWTFAARFPIEPGAAALTVEVAATHPSLSAGAVRWPGGDAVTITVTGPHSLLPVAHDAALASAAAAGRTPTGMARESYDRLGPVPRTTVDIDLVTA